MYSYGFQTNSQTGSQNMDPLQEMCSNFIEELTIFGDDDIYLSGSYHNPLKILQIHKQLFNEDHFQIQNLSLWNTSQYFRFMFYCTFQKSNAGIVYIKINHKVYHRKVPRYFQSLEKLNLEIKWLNLKLNCCFPNWKSIFKQPFIKMLNPLKPGRIKVFGSNGMQIVPCLTEVLRETKNWSNLKGLEIRIHKIVHLREMGKVSGLVEEIIKRGKQKKEVKMKIQEELDRLPWNYLRKSDVWIQFLKNITVSKDVKEACIEMGHYFKFEKPENLKFPYLV